ncbi:hypothetical protein E2562_019491 [Oryza meyeriana var. granulata]|uniref:Uncharacterized protein n=1 Tax=Oryza meyeriana var. granulata TaxID=110450 RepID=A0A6G1DKI8_9ORYZ|nr:hypothetical protein E2562_019491 [Oryza meyeriana var. granulata]
MVRGRERWPDDEGKGEAAPWIRCNTASRRGREAMRCGCGAERHATRRGGEVTGWCGHGGEVARMLRPSSTVAVMVGGWIWI